jgi:hypothetical protein
MTNQELSKWMDFINAIEQWRKAGDAWQRIGNNSMHLMCLNMEAQLATEAAQFRTALIPATDRSSRWRAKISA